MSQKETSANGKARPVYRLGNKSESSRMMKKNELPPPQGTKRSRTPAMTTDGACASNGRSGARGCAGVFWDPNNRKNVLRPLTGRQKNNTSEVAAPSRAVHVASDPGMLVASDPAKKLARESILSQNVKFRILIKTKLNISG
uniref:RNase H type-1 domain-containing protein n=1 Tax=Strigamia maritima TaxID=126957 RepID=T1JF22_STRMM